MSAHVRCTACRCLTTVDDERRADGAVCFGCRAYGGATTYPASIVRLAGDWTARMVRLVPFAVSRGYGTGPETETEAPA